MPVPQKPAMRALLLSLLLLGLATAQVWISPLKISSHNLIFHVAAEDKGWAEGKWDCFQEMWWDFLWWKREVMSGPLQNKILSHFIQLIHCSHILHKLLHVIHRASSLTHSDLFSFIQNKIVTSKRKLHLTPLARALCKNDWRNSGGTL